MPFEVSGMEAEIAKFERKGAATEEACRRAVKAGAAHVVEALRDSVPKLEHHVEKGIRAQLVKYDAANGYYSDVGPDGDDPVTGEPLAKIGNILEYGRSNMDAQPWFYQTLQREEKAVIAVMDAEFSKG